MSAAVSTLLRVLRSLRALAAACHPGPTLAVTTLTGLLATASGLGIRAGALVVAAVFAGQLSIGWSNDLLDAARDRAIGRPDKPAARGAVTPAVLRACIVGALLACVVLSFACGMPSAATHLGLGVAAGWAYNLGLKATRWSALPYALAFGTLPAVVTLAGTPHRLPPAGVAVTAGLLGVAAHLFNALPDLADDRATGVVGMPHRLGAHGTRLVGAVVLVIAALVSVIGSGGPMDLGAALRLSAALVLSAVVVRGPGRTPFIAVIGMAFLCLWQVAGVLAAR